MKSNFVSFCIFLGGGGGSSHNNYATEFQKTIRKKQRNFRRHINVDIAKRERYKARLEF